MPITYTVEAEL